MNVQIEWEGGVPEPLASIYRAMSGDGEALTQAARQLWGIEIVEGIMDDAAKKARRVDDVLDGVDPFKRIEGLLGAALSQPGRGSSALSPDEMSSREAAAFLNVSVDTLHALVRAGRLPRRNVSPHGSSRGPFLYKVADLAKLRDGSYLRTVPRDQPKRVKARKVAPPEPNYDGLDL